MAKIISLNNTPSNFLLVQAAWNFAYAALWSNLQLSATEIETGKEYIKFHLAGRENSKRLFCSFCERIIIAYQQLQDSHPLPPPSLWLSPEYAHGYVATGIRYQEIISNRKIARDYCAGMAAVAAFYLNRTSPSPTASFVNLRKRLIRLQEAGLLALLCKTLAYHYFL